MRTAYAPAATDRRAFPPESDSLEPDAAKGGYWRVATNFSFSADLRARITGNLASFQPRLLAADALRHAAVGVVLLPDVDDRACFVLTRRLSTLRRHAGQWALPGGQREPGESSEAAALREVLEEINLDLRPDAVLGQLDDFVTRS